MAPKILRGTPSMGSFPWLMTFVLLDWKIYNRVRESELVKLTFLYQVNLLSITFCGQAFRQDNRNGCV